MMTILNIEKETLEVEVIKNQKKIKKKEVEAIKKKDKSPEKVEDLAPR